MCIERYGVMSISELNLVKVTIHMLIIGLKGIMPGG